MNTFDPDNHEQHWEHLRLTRAVRGEAQLCGVCGDKLPHGAEGCWLEEKRISDAARGPQ